MLSYTNNKRSAFSQQAHLRHGTRFHRIYKSKHRACEMQISTDNFPFARNDDEMKDYDRHGMSQHHRAVIITSPSVFCFVGWKEANKMSQEFNKANIFPFRDNCARYVEEYSYIYITRKEK